MSPAATAWLVQPTATHARYPEPRSSEHARVARSNESPAWGRSVRHGLVLAKPPSAQAHANQKQSCKLYCVHVISGQLLSRATHLPPTCHSSVAVGEASWGGGAPARCGGS